MILRYRRLTSSFEPTPHDVWDKYLDIYGVDGVFPVARTEIGNLGMIASEEILYPEFTRMHVMRGAEVIIHPTSEPGSPQLTIKETCRQRPRDREPGLRGVGQLRRASTIFRFPPTPAARCPRSSDRTATSWPRRRQGGESMSANAVLDVSALRREPASHRHGQYHVASAIRDLRRELRQADYPPANFLLRDGKVIEPPNRDVFRRRQEDNIERLIKAGLL